ncbi:MAG: aspartate-semialdehyde dehydrogenase, partial [Prosthecobacter sp.]
MSTPKNVAIVGATGAVGAEMIRCLEQRGFPVGQLT